VKGQKLVALVFVVALGYSNRQDCRCHGGVKES
jgi:hypothetical protein